jgi:Ser/Thr protein kinase RdoA (MazF antagonist)
MIEKVLSDFGLLTDNYKIESFGSGLINSTWKISGAGSNYILQRINKDVFKSPQDIADNLVNLESYLKAAAPAYLFTAPVQTVKGEHIVLDEGNYYRLSPFIDNSHTVDFITQSKQAYEAARQFGKFTRLLNGFDPHQLKYTLPNFHNLNLRVQQFKTALLHADSTLLKAASDEIRQIEDNIGIADTYARLVTSKQIPLRVIHHDTKINNVLFNCNDEGLCVIDLDTVMPGYYISDVGDMMRTYLSAANEEEKDFSKIQINEQYFKAVYTGYMEEMGSVLTETEKSLFVYSGKFMIYMQAIRFLADFLNGDVYYHSQYPGHNLVRAQNQLTLLDRYLQSEQKFLDYILQLDKTVVSAV